MSKYRPDEDMRRDLILAMKARDRVAVSALRSTLGVIANAEAVEAPPPPPAAGDSPVAGAVAGLRATEVDRRVLSDGEVVELVRRECAERRTGAAEYEGLGQHGQAARLRSEADVLTRYLAPPA